MLYALNGLFVAVLLALWSLAAWALHALAVWSVAQAGALSGTAAATTVPGWLRPWLPPDLLQGITQWITDLGPWVDSLLQAAPALAGALTALAWGVWGLGSLLLLTMGIGLHLLIALWRRRRPPGAAVAPQGPAQHHRRTPAHQPGP